MEFNSSSRGITVLVVDDNTISRRFTVAALRETAGSVKQARSGAEAVDSALRHLPSVIFMDMHLQDISGIEALGQIHGRWPENRTRPRAIIVTADDSPRTRQQLSGAGIDQLLHKPVGVEQLRAALQDTKLLRRPQNSPVDSAALALRPLFLAELRTRIPDLDENISALDWSAASELVHQLIASCAICGEKQLERSARDLYSVLIKEAGGRELAMNYYFFLLTAGQITDQPANLRPN